MGCGAKGLYYTAVETGGWIRVPSGSAEDRTRFSTSQAAEHRVEVSEASDSFCIFPVAAIAPNPRVVEAGQAAISSSA
jgi:hypothetical protein